VYGLIIDVADSDPVAGVTGLAISAQSTDLALSVVSGITSIQSLTATDITATSSISLGDDLDLKFGNSDDFTMQYDNANEYLMVVDINDDIVATFQEGGGVFGSGSVGVNSQSTAPSNITGYTQIWCDSDNDKLYYIDDDGDQLEFSFEPPTLPKPTPSGGGDYEYKYTPSGVDYTEHSIEYSSDYNKRRKTIKHYKDGLLVNTEQSEWVHIGLFERLFVKL